MNNKRKDKVPLRITTFGDRVGPYNRTFLLRERKRKRNKDNVSPMPKQTQKQISDSADTILHQNLPLIEVAEPWLLDSILADAAAARCVVIRLSDRVAVAAPGQMDALLARLRKLGHTPKVLEG